MTNRLIPGKVARNHSPVPVRTRVATRDLELGGQPVLAGQTLLLLLGAANRDPRVCRDPDLFDIHRAPNHHLAFGEGPHYCLGSALARLEGRIAMELLLAMMPNLALAPGAEIHRQPNFTLRGWQSLPVVFA